MVELSTFSMDDEFGRANHLVLPVRLLEENIISYHKVSVCVDIFVKENIILILKKGVNLINFNQKFHFHQLAIIV